MTKLLDPNANPPAEIVWGSIADVLLRRSAIHIAAREKATTLAQRVTAKALAEELAFLAIHLRDQAMADARTRMEKADKAVTVTGFWGDGPTDPANGPGQ